MSQYRLTPGTIGAQPAPIDRTQAEKDRREREAKDEIDRQIESYNPNAPRDRDEDKILDEAGKRIRGVKVK